MRDETSVTIAVLGLGIMGTAMARTAARRRLRVVGWDRNPAVAAALAADGIHPAKTAAEAVADADVVVTMVPDGSAVMDVMEGQGAFAALRPGASWVQMSTIGVEGTERALRLAATRGDVTFVDAPVSGSKPVAEQGRLLILASGDRERAGEAVQRFFAALGTTEWLGEAGKGTRMKLLFNAWIAILNEGVAEIAILAGALGVELPRFAHLATGGPLLPSWASAKIAKIAENKTAETEFPLRWADKDVRLAIAAAGAQRAGLPMLCTVDAVWAGAVERFGGDDLSAIYVALRESMTATASR
ncbi:MAG: 3-hydroxyisobutyrate dehydrogenase [Candidatus Eremiobacteraeota bacterium]|nr:3-hydroxyisobutyrate dehydrogenase [Candidatus Eremiobacteraeota bacterium]